LLAIDLGGSGSTNAKNRNSFSLPNRSLPGDTRGRFEVGDSFFTQNWISAPASTQSRDGLGPTFNAPACAACHLRDGRGRPPDDKVPNRAGLLFRLSVPGEDEHGGPLPDPVYGGQLQDRAVNGVPPEGRMQIDLEPVEGRYADGTPYTLLAPTYSIAAPAFGPASDDLMISPRVAPGVFGVGLLEAIPDAALEAAADPDDADGDGISGRVNHVWSAETGSAAIGRFGWKANVATVAQQTAGAFHGDIGITSKLFPTNECPEAQVECASVVRSSNPEIDDETFGAVVFYTRVLAVPTRRPAATGDEAGARLFEAAGCSSCHTPEQQTGTSDIDALANETIHPYTDLLLHDMGAGLADGRPDFEATGSEWRTAPLWGLGLTETVNDHTRLLHDGRARTIEEAVLWHGGEAAAAQQYFLDLTAAERKQLLAFLESL
jgi:CxxC motif-containing protein (DUF1111 family)